MKAVRYLALCAFMAIASTPAVAQFVKGNEAVQVLADGSKKVETPPTAGALLAKPCPALQPGCSGGGWKMVETMDGAVECTEIYARPNTCRASTYGAEKLTRVWVVKSGSAWMQCQYPDLSKKCVSIKSLPISAVQ
jgi:hypothetical protein